MAQVVLKCRQNQTDGGDFGGYSIFDGELYEDTVAQVGRDFAIFLSTAPSESFVGVGGEVIVDVLSGLVPDNTHEGASVRTAGTFVRRKAIEQILPAFVEYLRTSKPDKYSEDVLSAVDSLVNRLMSDTNRQFAWSAVGSETSAGNSVTSTVLGLGASAWGIAHIGWYDNGDKFVISPTGASGRYNCTQSGLSFALRAVDCAALRTNDVVITIEDAVLSDFSAGFMRGVAEKIEKFARGGVTLRSVSWKCGEDG